MAAIRVQTMNGELLRGKLAYALPFLGVIRKICTRRNRRIQETRVERFKKSDTCISITQRENQPNERGAGRSS
jgi:hypothetical protein